MARPHSSVDSSIVKFSIVDDGSVIPVPAEVAGGRVRINPEALQEGLGWKLETEGLCRGEVCVPVRDRDALYDGNSIDLAAFATALGRPLALDVEERTAAIGTAPADRATLMAHLDIAGTAYTDRDDAAMVKGPTGLGVRLFSEFLLARV
jgi:hypothetical protein